MGLLFSFKQDLERKTALSQEQERRLEDKASKVEIVGLPLFIEDLLKDFHYLLVFCTTLPVFAKKTY